MAFDQKPIVDINSEVSEESVNLTLSLFSKSNGFNSDIVSGSKDYGVDVFSEIVENGGATGSRFPIQIKSTNNAKEILIQSEHYFSLSFLTSRLGYLCSHFKGTGLIVFYNKQDCTLYYDFVWSIYNRIRYEKSDESWKSQENVTIHIPQCNIVKTDLKKIHSTFKNQFKNFNILISCYGEEFGIKAINEEKLSDSDEIFNENMASVRYLESVGDFLFNKREYSRIKVILESLPKKYLNRNRILYLAALTYTEIGDFMDADYFLKLCYKKRSEFSAEVFSLIEMQRIKVDFAYGLFSMDEYANRFSQLKSKAISNDNLVNVEINICLFDIKDKIGRRDFTISSLEETDKLFELIETVTKNTDQKHFQKVFVCEIQILALSRLYADYINNKRILNKFNLQMQTEMDNINQIIYVKNNYIQTVLKDALEIAESSNNKLLKAHALHKLSLWSFSLYTCYFINNISLDGDEVITALKTTKNYALYAYKIFKEINTFFEAYIALKLALEIYELSENWLKLELDSEMTRKMLLEELETYREFPFYSNKPSAFNAINEIKSSDHSLKNLSIDEIENTASIYLKVNNLPPDRFRNIVKELMDFRYFDNNCSNSTLIMLSDQESRNDLKYANPSKYLIIDKRNNSVMAEGFDIKALLAKIGVVDV